MLRTYQYAQIISTYSEDISMFGPFCNIMQQTRNICHYATSSEHGDYATCSEHMQHNATCSKHYATCLEHKCSEHMSEKGDNYSNMDGP